MTHVTIEDFIKTCYEDEVFVDDVCHQVTEPLLRYTGKCNREYSRLVHQLCNNLNQTNLITALNQIFPQWYLKRDNYIDLQYMTKVLSGTSLLIKQHLDEREISSVQYANECDKFSDHHIIFSESVLESIRDWRNNMICVIIELNCERLLELTSANVEVTQ